MTLKMDELAIEVRGRNGVFYKVFALYIHILPASTPPSRSEQYFVCQKQLLLFAASAQRLLNQTLKLWISECMLFSLFMISQLFVQIWFTLLIPLSLSAVNLELSK